MTARALLGLVALLPPMSAAVAADANGLFAIRGAGLLTCKTFVEEREAASDVYIMIGGWLDGYVTAINELSLETFDITPYQSTELLTILIDRHCKQNPADLVYAVTNALLARLHSDRLDSSSAQTDVRVGRNQMRLYAATVARIQNALADRGLLDSVQANGAWNQSTQDALAVYQTSVGLEGTGFPDQATLWRLLTSE